LIIVPNKVVTVDINAIASAMELKTQGKVEDALDILMNNMRDQEQDLHQRMSFLQG
jgi:hypothetical protein